MLGAAVLVDEEVRVLVELVVRHQVGVRLDHLLRDRQVPLLADLLPRQRAVPDLDLVDGAGHVAAAPSAVAAQELGALLTQPRRKGMIGLGPIEVQPHTIRRHRHRHMRPLIGCHDQVAAVPPGAIGPVVTELVVLAEVESTAIATRDDDGRVVGLNAIGFHPGHRGPGVGLQAEIVGQSVAVAPRTLQRHTGHPRRLALARRTHLHHTGHAAGRGHPIGVGHSQ